MTDTHELRYLRGFGNHHESESVAGVLPQGQNSPQRVAHDLYAEQLSGTAFTAPRSVNQRSWLYRIRPSVRHLANLSEIDAGRWKTGPHGEAGPPAAQMRWDPLPLELGRDQTWLSGLSTLAANGNAHLGTGGAIHTYVADRSMTDEVVVNGDGEMMIVPQTGQLRLITEFGLIDVGPAEIAVIPRGVKFSVELADGPARGYLCENYGASFALPEPGLIGTNALAMARDFRYPVARYHADRPTRMVFKQEGRLFETQLEHTPLDVVGWHGNYAPYVYDLRNYCPVGAVLFDHPDPSIWTVLTSPSDTEGVANIDFVVFRDRWSVAEHTFRPPWFHSNVMSEFMGLVEGTYDAKLDGFNPGGMSLHNAMMPHGPDAGAFEAGTNAELVPQRLSDMLAIMFESRYRWLPTDWAAGLDELQPGYPGHWKPLGRRTDLGDPHPE